MAERPVYAILGRGQWAATARRMLTEEQRQIVQLEHTWKQQAESEDDYVSRLADQLRASRAQIAWLCVPPGPHVVSMIKAAIETRVHTIAEKPWIASRGDTEKLIESAEAKELVIGVDFEYCLLDKIQAWRAQHAKGDGLRFGGRFHVSGPDRFGLSALDNLGSHLFAIRRHATPEAEIDEISCAYLSPAERRVWIQADTLDFTHNKEPILQRFVNFFEAATEGNPFNLGLQFALGVAEDIAKYRARQRAQSRAL